MTQLNHMHTIFFAGAAKDHCIYSFDVTRTLLQVKEELNGRIKVPLSARLQVML